MNRIIVDTQGLSCPEPLIKVREAIKGGAAELDVICDSPIVVENVTRLLERYNWKLVSVSESGSVFTISTKA